MGREPQREIYGENQWPVMRQLRVRAFYGREATAWAVDTPRGQGLCPIQPRPLGRDATQTAGRVLGYLGIWVHSLHIKQYSTAPGFGNWAHGTCAL